MPNTQLDRRPKNTQLDRRVRYAQVEERPSRGWKGFSSVVEGPAAWLTSFLLIPCLIVVVLLLPPVNLWDRLQVFAYTRIGGSGGVLTDPDGTMVSIPPEGVAETFYANFSSVPRVDFIEGQAGRQFYDAAVALPDYLIAKSPIYSVDVRGTTPAQAIVDIPIPNDSLPYETLGVYSWNGSAWEHLPSRVLVDEDKIEAHLNFLPPNFMVMQTSPDIPEVTANLNVGQQLPDNVRMAGEVRGAMTLRGDGALNGEVPPSNGNTLLLVSNVEGAVVRSDLINNLLLEPGQQDNQLDAIEKVVSEGNFRGVVVDYREVDAAPSARADYVFFITRLAERLHNLSKELIVRVAQPTQVSAEDWNTLGYDWVALSDVADKLIVPAPIDPRAYRADGEMAALLSWATEMVERRKLQVELPVQSVETVGNYISTLGYKQALQPLLKQVDVETNGQEISLTADNPKLAGHLTKDENAGAYFYTYTDDQGAQRTVYLEDATSISYKLNLLRKYNVVDVTLQIPSSGDVDPNIWSVLLQFQTGVALATTYEPVSVAYTVYNENKEVITNMVRPLTDPRMSFTAAADVAKLQVEAQLVGGRGEALSDRLAMPLSATTVSTAPAPAVAPAAAAPAAGEGAAQPAAQAAGEIALVESKPTLPRINANTIVNVRSGPGTTFDVLGQIEPQNSYQAVGKDESGQWWQIDIGNNLTGWIDNEYVKLPEGAQIQVASADHAADGRSAIAKEAPATQEAAAQPAVQAAAAPEFAQVSATQIVNLRGGPGTNYPVLGQINAGGTEKILAKNEQGDWWQVEMSDGKPGWVLGELVSTAGDTGAIAVAQDIPQPPAPAEQPAANSAPAAAAPAPVAAPIGGIPFGYGIQAHMVHMGNEDKVMQMTVGMGFGWVKQQVEWRVFEPDQGARDFGALDNIVNAAGASNLNLLFSVVSSPAWAREPGFDGNVGGPPQNPQSYADFVGAMASKYCGTALKMIEVWNEQNLHYEWGNKPLNPGEYVQLLAAAYNAIKGACPSMIVISGALTPAGNNGGLAMDDFAYLEQMFQAGANNYLDAVGVHPSGYNVPPWATADTACAEIQKSGNSFNGACDSPHHSWSFQSTMLGYRNIMNVYGAGGKKLVPSEFGWAAGGAFNPNYAYANDNDYNEQADWTVQAYQMMKGWGWVGPAFLWNLNFRVVANGSEKAQWGIVDPGWGPLPAYNALAAMPK